MQCIQEWSSSSTDFVGETMLNLLVLMVNQTKASYIYMYAYTCIHAKCNVWHETAEIFLLFLVIYPIIQFSPNDIPCYPHTVVYIIPI